MPPIRWLFLAVVAINTSQWIKIVSADRPDLPVASNGWRPIVGERYESVPQNVQPQIKQNNNNNNNNQHIAENSQFNRNKEQNVKTQTNHNNFNKNGAHIRVNHHGSSGHHSKHNVQTKPLHKPTVHPNIMNNKMTLTRHPSGNKGHQNQHLGAKRHKVKPQRPSQMTSHSNRDELIAPAPSSAIGSYAYFNQGPFNVRDTQIGNSKYPFQSPYNLQTSNSEILPHLIPSYTFAKHPSQNELHNAQYNQYFNQNDEFTRNLVPPPPLKPQEKEVKEGEKLLTNPQFILNKMRDDNRHYQDVVLQLQSPYSFVNSEPVDLEITKEKFREYHTTVSPLFSKATTEGYSTLRYTRPSSIKHYEVTEDKNWQENSPFYRVFSSATTPLRQQFSTLPPENDYRETTQFLPTPFIPENAFPTSPTQAEVSTIYSELSKLNRPAYQNKFHVKDVATHYPIFDLPKPKEQVIIPAPEVNEYINEVTTKRYEVQTDPPTTQRIVEEVPTEQYIQPTVPPTRLTTRLPQRNRVAVRRRRPTRPTTTTEIYEAETEKTTTERLRRRRPSKYRTTESSLEYNLEPTTRAPLRRKPFKPSTTTEEVSENYPINFPQKVENEFEVVSQKDMNSYASQETEVGTEVFEAQYMRPKEEKKLEESFVNHKMEESTTEYYRTTVNSYVEEIPETTTMRRRIKIRPSTTDVPTINLKTPENELDYTTITPQTEEPITIKETYQTYQVPTVYQQPEPEVTTIITTTTTEAPTTKSNRLRRPVKFDTHRPRFSVKDYRQRLTQYTSTTESGRAPEIIGKIKYPSRFTKSEEKEDVTESYRMKFKPKDPRHRLSTTERISTETSTERAKPSKRPYVRSRSTEGSVLSTTTAPRISIKPNIFSNLKRPQPISLRNRIYNKNKNLSTTTEPIEISTEQAEVTISVSENKIDTTTESYRRISEKENTPTQQPEVEQQDQEEVDDNEAFMQLQRISELTSSSKNHFHTMSSPSRRIPNYFTISTDDPILPIEAFFPKISQRNGEQ